MILDSQELKRRIYARGYKNLDEFAKKHDVPYYAISHFNTGNSFSHRVARAMVIDEIISKDELEYLYPGRLEKFNI